MKLAAIILAAGKSHRFKSDTPKQFHFYKKDLTFNVLGPVGDIVSEWIIKGAYIKDAAFGEYDWASEGEAQELTMTVTPDYCVLNF